VDLVGAIGGGNSEASAAISDLLDKVISDRTEEADSALDAVLNNDPANPTSLTMYRYKMF
jgi:hypothetical protein